MSESVKAACIQMNGGPDMEENFARAAALIRKAAAQGAQFVATPENTDQMRFPPQEKLKGAFEEKAHPGIPFFAALAKELGIGILVGSMAVKRAGEKLANRSFLFSSRGDVIGRYDKIHLFDVDLPGGESYRESALNSPGDQALVADAGFAKIGMSICYDLRFPHLYRDLAKKGAAILTVPAAFTVPTGKAHWEVLLRARAIENGAFVLAPAQCGTHQGRRKTYGHSAIIGPWGEVLAQAGAGKEEGMIIADLDLGAVEKARGAIPSLRHDRDYEVSG